MTQGPKYLTGDSAALNEFIDRFDVSLTARLRSAMRRANLVLKGLPL